MNSIFENIKIIGIGGSAGSFNTIINLVNEINPKFDIPIVIVTHRGILYQSHFEELLNEQSNIDVKEILINTKIEKNYIYIAPANYHLIFENSYMFALESSERVNFSRPSIDVFFESLAYTFKESCLGILLSGSNADGALGLLEIHKNKGLTIIEDPKSAEYSFMPESALNLFNPTAILIKEKIINLFK